MGDEAERRDPRIQPTPLGAEKAVNNVLERVAGGLTSVVAGLLVLFVMVAVVGIVLNAWTSFQQEHDVMHAAVAGLDAAFVAIILLELVHTTLSRGPVSVQVQEFLVIGVTSAIRTGLETAAGRGTKDPRAVAIDLAITSFAALLLVLALWLIRQRLAVERQQQNATDSGERR